MADIKDVKTDDVVWGQSVVVPAMAEQAKKGDIVKLVREGQDGTFGAGYYEVLAGAGESHDSFGEVGVDMIAVEDDNGHITLANINPDYPHAYEFALMELISEDEQAEGKKEIKKAKKK